MTRPLVLASVLLLVACGGSTTHEGSGGSPSGGSGGSGGASGGSGGASGGFGGASGGFGGAMGGFGGAVGGFGGAVGGFGGAMGGFGGTPGCQPLGFCNWCNGVIQTDMNGCQHFVCANGVDPCVTNPCQSSQQCPAGQVCGADMLCWPPNAFCSSVGCSGGPNGACGCDWKCNDGKVYSVQCGNGGTSCSCMVDGAEVSGCGSTGAPMQCDNGACCGLPPFK